MNLVVRVGRIWYDYDKGVVAEYVLRMEFIRARDEVGVTYLTGIRRITGIRRDAYI